MRLTQVTVVIDQYNLVQEMRWCTVHHGPNGTEEGGPSLVVETDDNTCLGQVHSKLMVVTPCGSKISHIIIVIPKVQQKSTIPMLESK